MINTHLGFFTRLKTHYWLIICSLASISQLVIVPFLLSGRPDPVFDSMSIDFGTFPRSSQPQRHELWVSNRGSRSLTILFTGSSCGCASVIDYDKVIGAGKRGRILLEVDPSKSLNGLNMQHIVLRTNASPDVPVMISLGWRVRDDSALLISPTEWNVVLTPEALRDRALSTRQQVLLLDRSLAGPVNITSVKCTKNISATVETTSYKCSSCTGAGSRVIRVTLSLNHDLAEGPIDEQVTLTTDHKQFPQITIPIHGQVISRLIAEPKHVILETHNRTSGKPVIVTVRTRDGSSVSQPTNIRANDPSIAVSATLVGTVLKISVSSKPVDSDLARPGDGAKPASVIVTWPDRSLTIPVTVY